MNETKYYIYKLYIKHEGESTCMRMYFNISISCEFESQELIIDASDLLSRQRFHDSK